MYRKTERGFVLGMCSFGFINSSMQASVHRTELNSLKSTTKLKPYHLATTCNLNPNIVAILKHQTLNTVTLPMSAISQQHISNMSAIYRY